MSDSRPARSTATTGSRRAVRDWRDSGSPQPRSIMPTRSGRRAATRAEKNPAPPSARIFACRSRIVASSRRRASIRGARTPRRGPPPCRHAPTWLGCTSSHRRLHRVPLPQRLQRHTLLNSAVKRRRFLGQCLLSTLHTLATCPKKWDHLRNPNSFSQVESWRRAMSSKAAFSRAAALHRQRRIVQRGRRRVRQPKLASRGYSAGTGDLARRPDVRLPQAHGTVPNGAGQPDPPEPTRCQGWRSVAAECRACPGALRSSPAWREHAESVSGGPASIEGGIRRCGQSGIGADRWPTAPAATPATGWPPPCRGIRRQGPHRSRPQQRLKAHPEANTDRWRTRPQPRPGPPSVFSPFRITHQPLEQSMTGA